MELREALTQIAEIRSQMARGQVFRGYRSATTAFSGVVALAAAFVQRACLSVQPGADPVISEAKDFVALWVIAAAVCLLAVGLEMAWRSLRLASPVQRELTLLAAEQFIPSVLAGGLLTWVFWDFFPANLWLLPGLWMILFSLGMFASARLLPRMLFAVAGFYLVAGVATLIFTSGHAAFGESLRFCPWVMGGVFGAGQFMTAGILYWTLERKHER